MASMHGRFYYRRPYAIKNQRRMPDLVLYGIIELAPAIPRIYPRHTWRWRTLSTTNVLTQIPGDKPRAGSPAYRSLHWRHSAGRLYPLSQRSRLQETSCCLLQSGNYIGTIAIKTSNFFRGFKQKIFNPTFSSIQENKKEDFTRAKLDFEECSQLGILIDKEPRNASKTWLNDFLKII